MYADRSAGLFFLLRWIMELIFVVWVIGFILFVIKNPAAAAQMAAHAIVKIAEWVVLTSKLVAEQWRLIQW